MISRFLKSGAHFTVEAVEVDGKRDVVARVDGMEIGRGSQVGWALAPRSVVGDKTHAAGKVGSKVVGMTEAEAKRVGRYLYAEEIARAVQEHRHDALYNEGHADGFNPHA